MSDTVIWHDLECGRYERDLPLWLDLAATYGAGRTILDVGAGTGRVSLALGRAGYSMIALDYDAELLAELALRVGGLPIKPVLGDARDFKLSEGPFGLCIVPMQTLQLLGGEDGRVGFMRSARSHLADGGVVAVAIADADDFEEFEWHEGDPYPLPDMLELDGCLYSSQPTAVRRDGGTFVLERRREVVDHAGGHRQDADRIALDVVTARDVEEAGLRAGLKPLAIQEVPPTGEHIGSEVVILGL